MKVLALELSSSVGSVAFRDDDGTRLVRAFPADRRRSGLFYDNLSLIYRRCAPLDRIAVGLGPGSYAGVRISIATAFGLSSASGARLLGLPSICAIDFGEYGFIGDARRNSFFFAHVIHGHYGEGPTLVTEEEARRKLSDWHHLPIYTTQPLPQFENVTVAHPSALLLADLARNSVAETKEAIEPIYLRQPYITTPRELK